MMAVEGLQILLCHEIGPTCTEPVDRARTSCVIAGWAYECDNLLEGTHTQLQCLHTISI